MTISRDNIIGAGGLIIAFITLLITVRNNKKDQFHGKIIEYTKQLTIPKEKNESLGKIIYQNNSNYDGYIYSMKFRFNNKEFPMPLSNDGDGLIESRDALSIPIKIGVISYLFNKYKDIKWYKKLYYKLLDYKNFRIQFVMEDANMKHRITLKINKKSVISYLEKKEFKLPQ